MDELAVGVVVGDCSVVLVVDDELDDEPATGEVVAVVAVDAESEAALVVETPAVDEPDAVEAVWWGWAARAANTPTPASDPAATMPVTARLRRSRMSRRERVVMYPFTGVSPRTS